MAQRHRVTLIPGDGIGPEVTDSACRILAAAGAAIDWDVREAGAVSFKKGVVTGVPDDTIASLRTNRVALKGPLETPVGFGEKSANVTLRKLFETFANLRPVRELPNVPTPFAGKGIDLVVVRENVEDLYAGIEHMQTPGVAQCLKLMSRKGCEKVVRMAFAVAEAEGRTRVHCATKANIMKLTEGLMKRTFEEIAREYPDIQAEHIIVDNCAHQLVRFPENFQVIVTSNMNGDILSDLTSGLIGGLGFAPGANVGNEVTIFEPVHGSAPKYAGRDVINPTAIILSAVMMLRHLDEPALAERVENAVWATLQDGIYTRDVRPEGSVGTRAYTEAIIARLGVSASDAPKRTQRRITVPVLDPATDPVRARDRRTVGVDIFVEATRKPEVLGKAVEELASGTPLRLKMISNRGTRVYPATGATPDCVDHWRCRFVLREPVQTLDDQTLLDLVRRVGQSFRFMHVEKLEELDGAPGWTRAQGED